MPLKDFHGCDILLKVQFLIPHVRVERRKLCIESV